MTKTFISKYILLTLSLLFSLTSFAEGDNQCAQSLKPSTASQEARSFTLPTKLKIVKRPASSLNEVSAPVPTAEISTPRFQQFLEQMVSYRKSSGGIGLAAPQVGVPYRVAVVRPPPNAGKSAYEGELILINPKVTPLSKATSLSLEGCLSITGVCDVVARFKSIQVDYLDHEGKAKQKIFDDYTAVIIQHEVDHLNGVLFPEISQLNLWKIGLRQASRLESVERKRLIQLFRSLTDQQRKQAKNFREKIREDLFNLDQEGTVIHHLKTQLQQELANQDPSDATQQGTLSDNRAFFKDLFAYYELRLKQTLDKDSLQQWVRTEAHALYALEDLYSSTAPELKALLSEVRQINPHFRSLRLNGIRGPPFKDLRQISVPIHGSEQQSTLKAPNTEEALLFSKAVEEFSIIERSGGFELRVREGETIKVMRAHSIPSVNQIYRHYLERKETPLAGAANGSPSDAKIAGSSANKASPKAALQGLAGNPKLGISYGLEAEYLPTADSALLNDYRPRQFKESDWLDLSVEERLKRITVEISRHRKSAEFVRVSNAPAWLPETLFGENDGNLEFNGMIYSNLSDAGNFLQQLEERYGKGHYQGHVVFPNGIPIKGLAGYLLFEHDLAQLETLEINYRKLKDNPNFKVGKNLSHHSLGPLGEADREALVAAEQAIANNGEIELGKTSKTLGPIVRTAVYPDGLAGVELRQFGTRSKALLESMEELSRELSGPGDLAPFAAFSKVPSIKEQEIFKAIRSFHPELRQKDLERFFEALGDEVQKATKAVSRKGSTGGQIKPGSRFLLPLRTWSLHPVLKEVPEAEKQALDEHIRNNQITFINSVADLVKDRTLSPTEALAQMQYEVVRWAAATALSPWFRKFKETHLMDSSKEVLQAIEDRARTKTLKAPSLETLPLPPFEKLGTFFDGRSEVFAVRSLDQYVTNKEYRLFMYNSVELIYDNVGSWGHIRLRVGDRLFAFDFFEQTTRDTFLGLRPKTSRVGFAWHVPYAKILEVLAEIDRFYNNSVTYNAPAFDLSGRPIELSENSFLGSYDGFSITNTPLQSRLDLRLLFERPRKVTGYIVREGDSVAIETPDGSRVAVTETEKGYCAPTLTCATSATFVLRHFFGIEVPDEIAAKKLRKTLLKEPLERPPEVILDYSPAK